MPPLGSNRLLEILLAFPLLYFNADTPITDFVYALFDLVNQYFEWNFSWKKSIFESRKTLVFGFCRSWKKVFECLYEPWGSHSMFIINYLTLLCACLTCSQLSCVSASLNVLLMFIWHIKLLLMLTCIDYCCFSLMLSIGPTHQIEPSGQPQRWENPVGGVPFPG